MKKHILIAVIIAAFANICTAQELKDKVYFDEDWNVIADASKATHYRLYNANDQSEGPKPYKDYYVGGKLMGEGFYSRIDKTVGFVFIYQGERKGYFENGNIKSRLFYEGGKLEGKAIYYNDSTGWEEFVYNYKHGQLDGRQVQYSPINENDIWKEEFFNKGVMNKEITYKNGNVRKIFTLISRNKDSFLANVTIFLQEDEDSLLRKATMDFMYNFDPEIWEYPFQMHYLETADINGEISQRHGKYQEFDSQERPLTEDYYVNGKKVGKSRVYNYKQNAYAVYDNDDEATCSHYYTLDNQPFTGQWDTRRINHNGCVGNCENGLMEGCWIQYDEYNRKTEEFNFKNGFQDGMDIKYYYDNDGELYFIWESNYVEGKIDGLKEGKILTDGEWETIIYYTYKNGILDGEFQDYSDSLFIKGHFKDDELDGYYQAYCNDANDNTYLAKEGNYKNGDRVGEWTYRYPDDNYYEIQYCDHSAPDRFYSYYDDAPYTGTVVRYFKNGKEKQIYTIKKSFIQRIDIFDTQTGKQTDVIKFKNGLPVYK